MAEQADFKYDDLLVEIAGWAKAIAAALDDRLLGCRHFVLGALKSPGGKKLLEKLAGRELAVDEALLGPEVLAAFDQVAGPLTDREFELAEEFRQVTRDARAGGRTIAAEPVLRQILRQTAGTDEIVARIARLSAPPAVPVSRARAVAGTLSSIDALRRGLSSRILGQDLAVDQVCDACTRMLMRPPATPGAPAPRGPRGIFTFVGPPGVGKTLMAHAIAAELGGPGPGAGRLLRLDMGAYSTAQAHEQLVGFSTAYTGARKGILTSFVEENPGGFVVVDELEKAHPNVQNFFLQVLDAGQVQDNHTRKTVDFSQATVVFTSNLGGEIYDAPNRSGFLRESQQLNWAVIESLGRGGAVAREDPRRREGISPELLSRLAKGAVVLFRRLDGLALEQIARQTVERVSGEFVAAAGLPLEVGHPTVLTLLLCRFGAGGDARRLVSGLEGNLYSFLGDLLSDHRTRLLEEGQLERLAGIRLLAPPADLLPREIAELLERKARVLVVDDAAWGAFPGGEFEWRHARTMEDADDELRRWAADFVLLDLNIGVGALCGETSGGLALLRRLRSRYPEIPVLLFTESPESRGLSSALLERVRLEGGARGVVPKRFAGALDAAGAEGTSFLAQLRQLAAELRRQLLVEHFQRRAKMLDFDLHPRFDDVGADRKLPVEIVRVCEVTAVAPADMGGRGWAGIPQERFADLAGAEEAKRRLAEVAGWLRDPGPLRDLDLDPPRGILMTGPPGTGKTSLARAVAGEAGVPFFAISGSEVLDRFIGESEGAVRDLFGMARRYAPAIVFIDEIDSIGGKRSGGEGGEWRASVLNELLAQMDGFARADRPVFVLGATNRPDTLDPALLRPGRFDLRIEVPNPNAEARERIFALHLSGMTVEPGVEVRHLSLRTAGMSGAEIRQVCREAGFMAVRSGARTLTRAMLEEAITILRHGLATDRIVLSEEGREATAVHEAGHALAQHLLLEDEPLTQVTILPRGRSLGFAEHGVQGDYVESDLRRLRARAQVLLAGRAAEELLLGDERASAGCSSDLARATRIALEVVGSLGMDPAFGVASLDGLREYLGGEVGDSLQRDVAARASAWLGEQKEAVLRLLAGRRAALDELVRALEDKETLYAPELAGILSRVRRGA